MNVALQEPILRDDHARFGVRRNDWESEFFRRDIRTLAPDAATGLSIAEHLTISPNVDLWECRVPMSATQTVGALVSSGFFVCDTICDFSFDLSRADLDIARDTEVNGYAASISDIPKLHDLIDQAGFQTRFERPPFSPVEGARFYGEWVRNAVLGTFDNTCAILSRKGEILGFVTLRDVAPHQARIGLIYTSLGARRAGVGNLLFSHAVELSRRRGITTLLMATQLTNRGAIALSSRMKGMPIRIGVHMYLPRAK
jgi:dTDP-4-amino-4,6-dideoxy-D-galactose acyltransferase